MTEFRPHTTQLLARFCGYVEKPTWWNALQHQSLPLLPQDQAVGDIVAILSNKDERISALGPNSLAIPPAFQEFLSWGFHRAVRFAAMDGDRKLIGIQDVFDIEQAAITEDGQMVVTTSPVSPVIRLYDLMVHRLSLKAILYAKQHGPSITAITICRNYSVIVSGCDQGTCCIWDLNRLRLVTSMSHASSIAALAIHSISGDIIVCAGMELCVYDINGRSIARYTTGALSATITCIVMNETRTSEWQEDHAFVTGHTDGAVYTWLYSHDQVCWCARFQSASSSPITRLQICLEKQRIISGHENGELYLWIPE